MDYKTLAALQVSLRTALAHVETLVNAQDTPAPGPETDQVSLIEVIRRKAWTLIDAGHQAEVEAALVALGAHTHSPQLDHIPSGKHQALLENLEQLIEDIKPGGTA